MLILFVSVRVFPDLVNIELGCLNKWAVSRFGDAAQEDGGTDGDEKQQDQHPGPLPQRICVTRLASGHQGGRGLATRRKGVIQRYASVGIRGASAGALNLAFPTCVVACIIC